MADWDRAVVGQFSELGVQRCRAVMKFAYWWGFDTKMNKQIEIKRERERAREREGETGARRGG
jgi:L-fucose isomerase-like protein